jgi:hypothetical protein
MFHVVYCHDLKLCSNLNECQSVNNESEKSFFPVLPNHKAVMHCYVCVCARACVHITCTSVSMQIMFLSYR